MLRRRSQRGEGNLGCILWAALLAVAAFIAWKAIPAKIHSAEIYDFMEEQAKFAAQTPAEEIKKAIIVRGNELGVPLSKDNVFVERLGDKIRMRTDFTIPLEFPGYTYNWTFHHELERSIFIF